MYEFSRLWDEIGDKYGIGSPEWHSHARHLAGLEEFLDELETSKAANQKDTKSESFQDKQNHVIIVAD